MPKQSLVRFVRMRRVESGKTLEIRSEKAAALSVNFIAELELQEAVVINYQNEYEEEMDFNEDFGPDFSS